MQQRLLFSGLIVACLAVAVNGQTAPEPITEAGLRHGEIRGLEYTDIDLNKRQLCVARSDWRGHATAPKGGRIRHVPLTVRLTAALRQGSSPARAACDLRQRG
jgi:integrase